MTWTSAQKSCERINSNLASIHSAKENAVVHKLVSKSGKAWSHQLKQHWSKLWMGGWLQFVLHKLEAKGAFLHASRYIWKLHWDTLEWRVEWLESESKLNVRMQLHVQSLGTTSWQVIWCLWFNWKQPRKLYSVKLVAWIFFPFVGPRLKVKVEKLGARKDTSKPERYFIDEFIKVSRSS